MSRRSSWNDDEQMALYGLSLLARVIYLQVFRWRMDYSTGIVGGPGRKLSYFALAEAADFIPDKGSNVHAEKPTRGRLRAVVRELIRAGLIKDAGSSKEAGLIFRCILADMDQSAQNMNDTGTTQERPSMNDTSNNNDYSMLGDVSDTGTTQERPSMNDTPPISGISDNNSVAVEELYPRARVDRDAMVSCLANLGFSHVSVHTPKVIGMIERWCSDGVELDDVCNVVNALREQGRQFTPAYLDKPVMQFLNEKNQQRGVSDEASKSVRGQGDPFAESLFGSPDPALN